MWRDHTYLGPTPKIRYVPDKDLTFPDSNPLFPDKDFRFSSSQIRYFPDRDIWELLGASPSGGPVTVFWVYKYRLEWRLVIHVRRGGAVGLRDSS